LALAIVGNYLALANSSQYNISFCFL